MIPCDLGPIISEITALKVMCIVMLGFSKGLTCVLAANQVIYIARDDASSIFISKHEKWDFSGN